jgi:hypothetical protein
VGRNLLRRTTPVLIAAALVTAASVAACSTRPSGSDRGEGPITSEVPPPVGAGPGSVGNVGGGPPTASSFVATADRSIGGCTLFPRDHVLNARAIDTLPLHPRSDTWIEFLGGAATNVHAPHSSVWEGARPGMPINVVDSRQVGTVPVQLNHSWASKGFHGEYPIPPAPRLEGDPSIQWDQHLIMVDVADCTAYELIQYDPRITEALGVHTALAGARYPLDTTEAPEMTTNAPNTPMVGQYVMVDEVDAGRVEHPIGFCSDTVGTEHIWPARTSDGVHEGPDAAPMGTWIRLRGDVDLERFTGQARPIAEGLRRHGAILTDTCGQRLGLLGENSDRWVDTELDQVRALTAADFEVVDAAPMMRSEESFAIR